MSLVPILLRPRIRSLRNRWRSNFDAPTETARDLIILGFALFLMACIFEGTRWSLAYIRNNPNLAALPPSQPLGLILMVLFWMLVISNLVSALGAFFLSEDLDLILASPISRTKFFFGRFLHVTIVSSWMPLTFILPLLLAFGITYDAGIDYYLVSAIVLIPYFLIPTTVAIVIGVVLSTLIPASKTKLVRFLLGGLFLYGLCRLLALLHHGLSNVNSAAEIVRMLQVLSMPDTLWIPSRWAAACLEALLRPTESGALPDLSLLYFVTGAVGSLAYLLIDLFHHHAYSNARNNRSAASVRTLWFDRAFRRYVPLLDQPTKGLILKEVKGVSREITHLLELAMLSGLCILYLYNLRIFAVLDNVPPQIRGWWQNLLFILNVGMDAFVATALCTRFVYPSISRDGKAHWLLYTSPLSVRDVMWAKFFGWFFPVGLIASGFFAAGAYALGVPSYMVVITSISSWIISYGIVGSAIGFGAMFALFDWEHPSELAAGFGSFVYMIYCTMLIFFNMIPIWILLFVPLHSLFGIEATIVSRSLIYIAFAGALIFINHMASRWAMQTGERKLTNALK